jgi:Uma2 family endonuclease
MTALASTPQQSSARTMQDILDSLGNIPASRVRVWPYPGTATEQDVTFVQDHENRTCELIDGTLVEKGMGFWESVVAATLVEILGPFVRNHQLGIVSGPDGTVRLKFGLVRAPDVAFISRSRLPSSQNMEEAIPNLIPDLAIEVLSRSNTAGEMERKRREYFAAGVRLVWTIDRRARKAIVYTSADQGTVVPESGSLDGGDVLPGFALSLQWLFGEIDKQAKQNPS